MNEVVLEAGIAEDRKGPLLRENFLPIWCLLIPLSACKELEKPFATSNLTLQEQCAKQAQLEFTADGFGVERNGKYKFMNHYNRALNRCFIEEYVDNRSFSNLTLSSYSSIFVSDVYEHRQYASFAAPLEKGGAPAICEVTTLAGVKVACKSEKDFNDLVKQYME